MTQHVCSEIPGLFSVGSFFLFLITMVQFPNLACEEPPAWLPWTNDEWKCHRVTWYDAIDEVFNVNTYLKDFFNLRGKEDDAEKSVAAFVVSYKTDV